MVRPQAVPQVPQGVPESSGFGAVGLGRMLGVLLGRSLSSLSTGRRRAEELRGGGGGFRGGVARLPHLKDRWEPLLSSGFCHTGQRKSYPVVALFVAGICFLLLLLLLLTFTVVDEAELEVHLCLQAGRQTLKNLNPV